MLVGLNLRECRLFEMRYVWVHRTRSALYRLLNHSDAPIDGKMAQDSDSSIGNLLLAWPTSRTRQREHASRHGWQRWIEQSTGKIGD